MKPISLLCLAAVAMTLAIARAEPAATSSSIGGSVKPFVDQKEIAGAVVLVATRDGVKQIATVGQADVEKYGRWAFDNPKHLIANLALGGGYPHGVNKIEKPYFGISDTTVDAIKQDKAAIQIDWIRVTQQ